MDDTHPHTQSFEDAIAITPESSQAYRVNLSSDWAIGDVPHGGYLAAIFYRTSRTYFSKTHPRRHGGRASPITMQLTFVRRCHVGPAWLSVEDIKLGTRTSIVRVMLSQETPNALGRITKLIGNITVSNLEDEDGLSAKGDWDLGGGVSYGPPLVKTPDAASENNPWKRVLIPHPEFRRAPAHVEVYNPQSASTGEVDNASHQWATLRWTENGDPVHGRWTNEASVFLLDVFPTRLALLEREVNAGTAAPVPVWFPTLALSIDFKKVLPANGVNWLHSKVTTKSIRGGRMDVEVALLDDSGDIIALASHATLIMSSSRNRARI